MKNNRESREEEVPRKTYVQKPDGFEPFINQEPQENNLFVNNYGGNYAQRMELNRVGVERALKIAHLEGKVFLNSLQQSRSRAEAQGNELAAKRFILFEKKTQKVEEENPYKRVVSVPEGWRIEINDQRITEELTEKKLAGQELQKTFINRFNRQLRYGLMGCVWREKLSREKDNCFRSKSIASITLPAMYASLGISSSLRGSTLDVAVQSAIGDLTVNAFFNWLSKLGTSKPPFSRSTDQLYEWFMPLVEIDKVAITYAYLAGKGRRLVREVQEEK